MFEVRDREGRVVTTTLIQQEALDRLRQFPQAHYVVEVAEIRQLIAVKNEQGGSGEASIEQTPETYF